MSDTIFDLVVKGNLVFPDHVLEDGVIAVKEGKIAEISQADNRKFNASRYLDARGKFVFPGIVDAHVHCYSNPDEGICGATSAAAAGGVTTIIEMPYDNPDPVNTLERFLDKKKSIPDLAKVDVALMATISKQGDVDFLKDAYRAGVCGIKLSLFETDPVRFPRMEDEVLWKILPGLATSGIPVGFHAENDRIIEALIEDARNSGRTQPMDHCRTRPPVTETLSVLKLLEFAYWTKFKLHLHHLSHMRSVEMAIHYREQGVDVSVETCPHYLVMTENHMVSRGAYARINPPMRSEKNMEALWRSIETGDMDIIGSDHAPWHESQKQNPDIFKNASGAAGLEPMLPLIFSEGVVNRGMNPCFIARTMARNPALRYGLFPEKGILAQGSSADMTILDPGIEWSVDGAKSHSVAKWSPYQGKKVRGKVVSTLVRGQTVFENDQLICNSGAGQFVPAHWGDA